jgi:hypothetical protein
MGTLYGNSNGVLGMVDNAGLAQIVSGSALSTVNGTSPVTGTGNVAVGFMTVPGGDVVAGSSFIGHASGNFTVGATVPSTAIFGVFWGGGSGTQIGTLSIPAADMPSGTLSAAGWFMDAEINFISKTESEVTLKVGWHSGSGVAASVQLFTVTTTTGLSTTGSENLALCFAWGSAPGSQSFVTNTCRLARVA